MDKNFVFSIEETAKNYINKRLPNACAIEKGKIINNWANKIDLARKIVEDFKLRAINPEGLKILDAGSGNGGVSIAFSEAGAEVCGLEVESDLVEIACLFAEANKVKAKFILYNGIKFPFADSDFDAVLSISVFEHVTDPQNYINEILRVLKPGGYLYLALPNRLWPKETHTLLWGITYLPYRAANAIARFFKRSGLAEKNLHFYTYWDVIKIIKKAESHTARFKILEEKGVSKNFIKKIIKKTLNILGVSYKAFLPHVQLILIKQS
jgi:2-polyprenyl-3-methyl-5-hydroxy-6-metoxy-1,4-benzoquinol methylase